MCITGLQLKATFAEKVEHLRTTLKSGMASDVESVSFEYAADKIVRKSHRLRVV